MLSILIKNGKFYSNCEATLIQTCSLGKKVTEFFTYLIKNRVDFNFKQSSKIVSFSFLRPDLKTRFINLLIAEKLITGRELKLT